MKEGVSIIICCYNSALLLNETLKHITQQNLVDLECEVILVDNASSDHTAERAKSIWSELNTGKINLEITYEPEPGLAFARKKGVTQARYEYLIFCDDDNRLDDNYAKTTVGLFRSNTNVAVLGGMGIAEFEDPSSKPFWFDKFYHGYAIGPQAERECIVNGVYGAGMAVRKSVFEKFISDHPTLLHDRKQTQLNSGGDGEIYYRMRLIGYQILYSPTLTFKHFLTTKRLTWDYLKRLHVGFSKGFVVLNLYEKALAPGSSELSYFNWLKKALYYWGIYLKYWPKHYLVYKRGEGSIEEIHHLTWKAIALSYFEYNFETVTLYRKIIAFKKQYNRQ